MKDLQKRQLIFLGGCIPTRLALVGLAKYLPNKYLPYLGLVTLSIALGFIYLYFTGKRTVGPETLGQPIWWRPFRIIHGLFYLIFSILAFQRYNKAYIFLLIDTFIGLGLFLQHYYM